MKHIILTAAVALAATMLTHDSLMAQSNTIVTTAYGQLEGTVESGITVFKGVPFAAPPVGDNRWRAPQPLQPWHGVRSAKVFGDDPMQLPIFGDMGFEAERKSEDCLYLNIWTPAKTMAEKLPVVIYFNGGGLLAGSGSEPRYAGHTLARHGIVAITANYREGIFGFFAHPELSKETSYKGSGNYGMMDQAAAIRWVHENIGAFGGDPEQITIVGESAGSMSVSAMLATPLTHGMISKAMASSGSECDARMLTVSEAEQQGVEALRKAGIKNIKAARAMNADTLQARLSTNGVPKLVVDGYTFTEPVSEAYRAGRQQHVPLLVGRNSLEMPVTAMLQGQQPTLDNVRKLLETMYGDKADEAMTLYGFASDADVVGKAGADLGSDIFIAYSTWLFGYLHAKTSGQPVYRYYYAHPRPAMRMQGVKAALAGGVVKDDESTEGESLEKMSLESGEKKSLESKAKEFSGAVHSADIEYAMGTLPTNRVYDWQPADYQVSAQFMGYYANFIKTGNPNGLGLAEWHTINNQQYPPMLILDVNSHEVTDTTFEKRNLFIMQNKK